MAADFLGAMFQGIGDTFKAGASVNVAKMQSRNVVEQGKIDLQAIDAEKELAKFNYLNQAASNQFKQQVIIIIAIAILVTIALIFRHNG